MAHTEESGFAGAASGLATVAVEPRSRTVIASPGVMPSIRKYHQHGQPRGSPPGMQSMRYLVDREHADRRPFEVSCNGQRLGGGRRCAKEAGNAEQC